jgi:His-Xaa-Ser system radical SAM maturase HxsC
MLITLGGRLIRALGETSRTPFVARITENKNAPNDAEVLLVRADNPEMPSGFRAYLLAEGTTSAPPHPQNAFLLAGKMSYLASGDVVRIDAGRGSIEALYRKTSPSNSLLVTERCDNYCLMCSQPPKVDDDSWLIDEARHVVSLMDRQTSELGITGGEPGLLGDHLVTLLKHIKTCLPNTAVHILSNGRAFARAEFSLALANVRHPDLMVGIPLYSDLAAEHDYVVQAQGAYNETIRGILALKSVGVKVELRVVLHRQTISRLVELARFITRNLLFVDHVALMGLELTGFAKTNFHDLWIDPVDYQDALRLAVEVLAPQGMNVSIYNHQLCTLNSALHRFARKSISDWKNTYANECAECGVRPACGGFFASSKVQKSRGIAAVALKI